MYLLTSDIARVRGRSIIEKYDLTNHIKYLPMGVNDILGMSAQVIAALKIDLVYTSGAWPAVHSMKILHTCLLGGVKYLMCNPGVFHSVSI